MVQTRRCCPAAAEPGLVLLGAQQPCRPALRPAPSLEGGTPDHTQTQSTPCTHRAHHIHTQTTHTQTGDTTYTQTQRPHTQTGDTTYTHTHTDPTHRPHTHTHRPNTHTHRPHHVYTHHTYLIHIIIYSTDYSAGLSSTCWVVLF